MDSVRQFSIGRHYFWYACFLTLATLGLLAVALADYRQLQQSEATVQHLRPHLRTVADLRYHASQLQQFIVTGGSTQDSFSLPAAERHYQAARQKLDALRTALPEDSKTLEELIQGLDWAHAGGLDIIAARLSGTSSEAKRRGQALPHSFTLQIERLISRTEQFHLTLQNRYQQQTEQIDASLQNLGREGLVLVLTLLLSTLAFLAWSRYRLHQLLGAEPVLIGQLLHRVPAPTDSGAPQAGLPALAEAIDRLLARQTQTEAALADSEMRLAQLLDQLPGGVHQLLPSPPYPFAFVSAGLSRLTGWSAQDFRTNHDFPDAAVARMRQEQIARAVQSRSGYEIEYQIERRDGRVCRVLERGQPRYLPDGTLDAIDGLILDYTEVKLANEQAERVRRQLLDTIESLDVGVLIYQRDQRLLMCNLAFQRFHPGLRPFLQPGQRMDQILRRYYRSADTAQQCGFASEEDFIKHWLSDTHGEEASRPVQVFGRWISQRHSSADDGTQVLLHSDVTEQTLLEQTLAQFRETTEQAHRAKHALLVNLSHELRTTTDALLGTITLTLQARLDDEPRENLAIAHTCGTALRNLIDDMLDLAKIETGQLELQQVPFSLGSLLHDTLAPLRQHVSARRLALDCALAPDLPDQLTGDPQRLQQIISHLLEQALRVTLHGEIGLEVEVLAQTPAGPRLVLTVFDNGPVIPPHQLAGFFDPFSQINRPHAHQDSHSGLSLALSQRLARLMGGDISLHSQAGWGNRFRVELPLQVAALQSEPMPDSPAKLAGWRVLIVDDHRFNRQTLAALLSRWGMVVRVAGNAEVARRLCQEEDYEIVLLDEYLPDGTDLPQQARLAQPHAVRLLLGNPGEAAQQLGAAACQPKPIRPCALLNTLLHCLDAGSASDEPLSRPAPAESRLAEISRLVSDTQPANDDPPHTLTSFDEDLSRFQTPTDPFPHGEVNCLDNP
ncbi:PAS domain-containing hybrid sensor histidine kinase/response regulator [Chitinimonas lacunae]|uniref:histidine kinase n=1 Tax=Chitinimonas lacunae TaxID=1963018 RepID=A0ABV8MUJ8_9NEIS